MVQTHVIHGKLSLAVFSFLLLALVTYSGSLLEKGWAASDTHIVAAGDWHCTDEAARAVNTAKILKPQLILGLGDYSSTETESCWVNLSKPVDSITKITLGNHDNEYDGLANAYLNHYGLSKQFYSFDIKNVHVLTMATEEEFGAGSEQYNFVLNDLRNSANNPNIKWIIITMHNPVYTSPNGCSDSSCKGDKELSELYHPLFDKYGVDIVLQAHLRNYQRSFPLEFNQQSPLNPTVSSTSKGEYKNPNGAIFAIVGTGGGELKHELEGNSTFMAYQQDTKFGILDMHFSDNILEGKFVANDGSTMDHFSISKTAKKKIIERISDDTFSGTNIRAVSDTETANVIPLAGQEAQDSKPSITFKLDEEATAASTNTKPLAENSKPSITFKLDEEATAASTNTKPLAGHTANPLAGQEVPEVPEVPEVKPAMTTKLDDSPPADRDVKPMVLSEEKVEREQDKPKLTTKLDNGQPTDDSKPMSLDEEKVDSSDNARSTSLKSSDNVDNLHVQDVLRSLDNSPIADEVSDTDEEKTTNTNIMDPFAALN